LGAIVLSTKRCSCPTTGD